MDCGFLRKKNGDVICDMCINSRGQTDGGKTCNGMKDPTCYAWFPGQDCAFCREGSSKANQSYNCGYTGPEGCESYFTTSGSGKTCMRCNYLAGYFITDERNSYVCGFRRDRYQDLQFWLNCLKPTQSRISLDNETLS